MGLMIALLVWILLGVGIYELARKVMAVHLHFSFSVRQP